MIWVVNRVIERKGDIAFYYVVSPVTVGRIPHLFSGGGGGLNISRKIGKVGKWKVLMRICYIKVKAIIIVSYHLKNKLRGKKLFFI